MRPSTAEGHTPTVTPLHLEEVTGQRPSFHASYADALKSLLGSLELEDLVAVYLQQVEGYLVLRFQRRH